MLKHLEHLESEMLLVEDNMHRATGFVKLVASNSRYESVMVGEKQAELAEASRNRHAEEEATRASENAKLAKKLHSAAAREDDDMTDEAAWQMRAVLAAEHEAAREAEAAAVGPRLDGDLHAEIAIPRAGAAGAQREREGAHERAGDLGSGW